MPGFGLVLQQLRGQPDQVLVVAQAVGLRHERRIFSPSDVDALFDALRVPRPRNTSQVLARLRDRGVVLQRSGGGWSLTPAGEEHVHGLVGSLALRDIEMALAGTPSADLAHAPHLLIPPSFAPPRWAAGIGRLLDRFPFETNVFCMTRFPHDERDPLVPVINTVRDALRQHGLALHLASDRIVEDDLFGNVGAYMWACQYGIGLVESLRSDGLNYNVVIELGSMVMTGRRCGLLRDPTAPAMPPDLSGHIYKEVDFADSDGLRREVAQWVANDLGLSAA